MKYLLALSILCLATEAAMATDQYKCTTANYSSVKNFIESFTVSLDSPTSGTVSIPGLIPFTHDTYAVNLSEDTKLESSMQTCFIFSASASSIPNLPVGEICNGYSGNSQASWVKNTARVAQDTSAFDDALQNGATWEGEKNLIQAYSCDPVSLN